MSSSSVLPACVQPFYYHPSGKEDHASRNEYEARWTESLQSAFTARGQLTENDILDLHIGLLCNLLHERRQGGYLHLDHVLADFTPPQIVDFISRILDISTEGLVPSEKGHIDALRAAIAKSCSLRHVPKLKEPSQEYPLDQHKHLVDRQPADAEQNGVRQADPPVPLLPPVSPRKAESATKPVTKPHSPDESEDDDSEPMIPAAPWLGSFFAPITQDIACGVPIGTVASDPYPPRRVFASCSEQGIIIRRTDVKDREGATINIADKLAYRIIRALSIKREDVVYDEGWPEGEPEDATEGKRVFNKLKDRGLTVGWGVSSFTQMRCEPQTPLTMREARRRLLGNVYGPAGPFDEAQGNDGTAKTRCMTITRNLRGLQKRVARAAMQVAGEGDMIQEARRGNNLIRELRRLRDGLTIEIGRLMEWAGNKAN